MALPTNQTAGVLGGFSEERRIGEAALDADLCSGVGMCGAVKCPPGSVQMTFTLHIDDAVARRFPGCTARVIQAGEELVSLVRKVWPSCSIDIQLLEPRMT